jgi:hypothetical protein
LNLSPVLGPAGSVVGPGTLRDNSLQPRLAGVLKHKGAFQVVQVLVQAPPGRLLRRMPARREFSSLAAAAAVTGGTECFAEHFVNPVSRRPCFKELRLIAVPTTLNKGSLLTRSGARDFNGNGSRVSASFGLWFAEPSRSGTAGFRSNSPLKTGTRPIHQASWPSPAFRPAPDQANGIEILSI